MRSRYACTNVWQVSDFSRKACWMLETVASSIWKLSAPARVAPIAASPAKHKLTIDFIGEPLREETGQVCGEVQNLAWGNFIPISPWHVIRQRRVRVG